MNDKSPSSAGNGLKANKLKGTEWGSEFLRADGGGGGQRQLYLVYPSAFGYTVPHLRERFGQAVAYIRPLQTHLDESPLKQEVINTHAV